jgi:hypothetical protein
MGMIFTLFVLILGISLMVCSMRAFVRWQGWWRWAGLAPLLLVLGVVLNIVLAIRADPIACATIWRSSAFMQLQAPPRLTVMMRSNLSSLVSS